MSRKRRIPKKKRSRGINYKDLPYQHQDSLILGDDSNNPLPNRKEIYETCRDSLIEFFSEHYPGMRPRAFWDYENDGEEGDWETLLHMGQLDEDELEAVRKSWVKRQHLRIELFQAIRDNYRKTGKPYNGMLWPDLMEEKARQADLLGVKDNWRTIIDLIYN